jgi:hypothetical protein
MDLFLSFSIGQTKGAKALLSYDGCDEIGF